MKSLSRGALAACCALLLVCGAAGVLGISGYRSARPGYGWAFPRDHASHPDYRTEWWYFTGWLSPSGAGSNTPLGYQFTVFRQATAPDPRSGAEGWFTRQVFLGHRSLIRPQQRSHRADFTISRGHPEVAYADTTVPGRVRVRGWELAIDEPWRIRVRTGRRRMDLRLEPTRPPLLHGKGGYSRKGPGARQASQYYSHTRMRTRGRVRTGGETVSVSGWSWFDHEFGSSQLRENQVEWDWLSLRLSDGSDLMVYRIRETGGTASPQSSLTLRLPSGEVVHLPAGQWSMQSGDRWRSPESGAEYPLTWSLRIPSRDVKLRVRPLFENQEMAAPGGRTYTYWEGMVRAEGRLGDSEVTGNGYLELTGYAGSPGGRF